MKTQCPACKAVTDVSTADLRASYGMYRCSRCSHEFDAFEHVHSPLVDRIAKRTPKPVQITKEPEVIQDVADDMHSDDSDAAIIDEFMQDVGSHSITHDTAIEEMKAAPVKSGNGWAAFFTIILVLVVLGQFAWIKRAEILRLPAAQPLCAYLDCSVAEQRNPNAFRVLSRELEADKTDARLLTLSLSFRNYADFAQRAPQMQLSLIDSVNSVLLRRTLAPSEYLPREIDAEKLIEPGQKIDIQLSIEDPGPQASGFTIDFF